MQRPKPSEGGIFKKTWFAKRRYNTPPANPIMIVQSWDTASKDKEFNDPSACTTWLVTRTDWYLLDVFKKKMIFPEIKSAIKSHYLKFKPDVVLIEDKSSGQELITDLRADSSISIPIVAIEPEASKELRAHAVSPLCEAGLVWLPEAAAWLLDFESEFFSFPLSTKKDQVDSATQFMRWMHVRSIELQVWGTGQQRAGHTVEQNETDHAIDDDNGIVSGSNDFSGW